MNIAIRYKHLNILFVLFLVIIIVAKLFDCHIGYSKIISGTALLLFPIYLGYSLKKILDLKNFFQSVILNNFLLGFLLLILIAFVSLALKINIIIFTIIIGVLLFVAIIHTTIDTFKNHVRIKVKIQNIYHFLELFIFIIFIGLVCYLGSNVIGDVLNFHIPIASKVDNILDPSVMTITKRGAAYPGYLFPVWHTLVGALSKILNTPVPIVWAGLAWPLAIIAVLSWKELVCFFITKKNNLLSLLVTATIIIVLTIKDVTFFYLVGLLPAPCQLCDYILMPLALFCAFKFLCAGGFRFLFTTIALYLAMTIIHGPHMVYLPIQLISLSIFLLIIGLIIKNKQLSKNSTILLTVFLVLVGILVVIGQYYSKITGLPTNPDSYHLLSFRRLVPIIILIPVSLVLIKQSPKKYILPIIAIVLVIQSLITIPSDTVSSLFHVALRRAHTTSLAYTMLFWSLLIATLYLAIQKIDHKKIKLFIIAIIIMVIVVIGFNVKKLKDFTNHYYTIDTSQPYNYIDDKIIEYILNNLNQEVIISDIYTMNEITQYSTNYTIYYKGEKTHEREIVKKDINIIFNKYISIDTIINICSKYNARYIIVRNDNHSFLSLSEQEEMIQLVASGKNQALYKIAQ